MQERRVDSRLSHQPGDEVDDTDQRRIVEDLIEAGKRCQEDVDDRLEWFQDVSDRVRDRLEDLADEAADLDAQVAQPEVELAGTLLQAPAPAEHQVALELRQPLDPVELELELEPERRLEAEVDLEDVLERVREDVVERQAAGGFDTVKIDREETEEAARLEARCRRLAVGVRCSELEEEQLALGDERCHLHVVERFTVEEDTDLDLDLRVGRRILIVRCQVEAVGETEPEAEVEAPVHLDREATVDVEAESRQVDGQRDIHAGAEGDAAEQHVELDRVGVGVRDESRVVFLGNAGAWFPRLHEVPVFRVPVDRYIAFLGDKAVAAGVEQNLQSVGTECVPERVANELDRLARAAELLAEIGDEARAQVLDEGGCLGELVSDEWNVLSEARAKDVLQRTERAVDRVDDERRVVEDAENVEARKEAREVRQATYDDRFGLELDRVEVTVQITDVRAAAIDELVEELEEGLRVDGGVRLDGDRMQRNSEHLDRQENAELAGERQIQILESEAAEGDAAVVAAEAVAGVVDDTEGQSREVVGVVDRERVGVEDVAVGAEIDDATLDTDPEGLDQQVEVRCDDLGAERQARAGFRERVVLPDEELDGAETTGLDTAEIDPDVDHRLDEGAELDLDTRVDELGNALECGEVQPQRTEGLEVEAEREDVLEDLVPLDVEDQLLPLENQREGLIVRIGLVVVSDAERVLDQLLDLLDHRGRILGRLLDLLEEIVDKPEHILQRPVHDRNLLAVEGLVGQRRLEPLDPAADRRDDRLEVESAEVEGVAEVRQDHHGTVKVEQSVDLRLRLLALRHGLEAGDVSEVRDRDRELLTGESAGVEPRDRRRDRETLECSCRVGVDIEGDRVEELAAEKIVEREATISGRRQVVIRIESDRRLGQKIHTATAAAASGG